MRARRLRAIGVAAAIAAAAIFAGCAGAAPPEPPPYRAPAASSAAVPAAIASIEDAGVADAAVAPEPPVDASPRPILAIEPAYRIDRRSPLPQEDRARWNEGGLGALVGPAPEAEGHPMPRVIIDVTRAAGAHRAADLQRELRKSLWGKVIECYGLGAYRNQALRGKTVITFGVSRSGAVSGAKVRRTTLADAEVSRCLATKPRTVALPRAKVGSNVTMEVQIGPGDDPTPPPASAIVPGDGALAPEAIHAAMDAAIPRFEACYRPALAYAPELWGRLAIRFHVTASGAVDEALRDGVALPGSTRRAVRSPRGAVSLISCAKRGRSSLRRAGALQVRPIARARRRRLAVAIIAPAISAGAMPEGARGSSVLTRQPQPPASICAEPAPCPPDPDPDPASGGSPASLPPAPVPASASQYIAPICVATAGHSGGQIESTGVPLPHASGPRTHGKRSSVANDSPSSAERPTVKPSIA